MLVWKRGSRVVNRRFFCQIFCLNNMILIGLFSAVAYDKKDSEPQGNPFPIIILFDFLNILLPGNHHENLSVLEYEIRPRHHMNMICQNIPDGNDFDMIFTS